MTSINRGPTANQLQPPKRIQPDLLYAEDLEEMFGSEPAKKGVHLEIVNAVGGTVSFDPAGKEKKRVIKLKLGDGKKLFDKQLVLNQTNKKALIAAFGSEYVSEWVGWITLFTTLVEDKKKGGMVPAIRIKNVRPKLQPTFDYAANTKKRQESAAKTAKAPPAQQQPEPEPEAPRDEIAEKLRAEMERAATASAGSGITDEERAAIAAAEREQFTQDPEDET